MASLSLDGSPTPRKRTPLNFFLHDEDKFGDENAHTVGAVGFELDSMISPNSPSDLNMWQQPCKRDSGAAPGDNTLPVATARYINQMPAAPPTTRNPSYKKSLMATDAFAAPQAPARNLHLEELLVKLSEQQQRLSNQTSALNDQTNAINAQRGASGGNAGNPDGSAGSSGSGGAVTNPYATTPRTDSQFNDVSPAELMRLKQKLENAEAKLVLMDQELTQTRITKHTVEEAMGSQFDSDFDHIRGLRPQGVAARVDSWVQSTEPGVPPASTIPTTANNHVAPSTGRGIWTSAPAFATNSPAFNTSSPAFGTNTPAFGANTPGIIGQGSGNNNGWPLSDPRSMAAARLEGGTANMFPGAPNSRGYSTTPARLDTGGMPPHASEPSSSGLSRPASAFGNQLHSWASYTPNQSSVDQSGITPPLTPLSLQSFQNMHAMSGMPYPMSENMLMQYNMPLGARGTPTTISPHAAEFHPGGLGNSAWGVTQQPFSEPSANYLNNAEPMNYRRLLDRNMSCNWKYIVDKIVHSNDQQASIFLQQKLKVGTQDQKYQIVQAIIDQAYTLMINRFGNFLVQRCFEHGTPEQVQAIASAIRGNTLNLSMDPFGCHVIQKAFDSVGEEYKAVMVHELLRRIPETVIHRYACHVWQKLFELRWKGTPPQIMKYVNEALCGMWHEVALGETGSLVVQNIFENCLEDDKRPCINEVLSNIDVIAHGQFGNWCIQHICEHGAIADRTHAIDHVLHFATEYSMDQFASKVVEKCLKIGGTEFLDRYLDRVCEARADRPRMPLIDIAGDQFGNYLIQYILSHADPQRREIVASHIRKHMVSLRGSKYGSRVAMLCSNPAIATRPGPPTGIPMGRNNGGYGDRAYGGNRGFPYSGGYR